VTSSFWLLLDVVAAYSKNTEAHGVDFFEHRFDGIRKVLKPHAVFGYATDNPSNDASSLGEAYLTQYTIIPALLSSGSGEAMVIVNSHSSTLKPEMLTARHLVLLKDFGDGVLLCRREGQ